MPPLASKVAPLVRLAADPVRKADPVVRRGADGAERERAACAGLRVVVKAEGARHLRAVGGLAVDDERHAPGRHGPVVYAGYVLKAPLARPVVVEPDSDAGVGREPPSGAGRAGRHDLERARVGVSLVELPVLESEAHLVLCILGPHVGVRRHSAAGMLRAQPPRRLAKGRVVGRQSRFLVPVPARIIARPDGGRARIRARPSRRGRGRRQQQRENHDGKCGRGRLPLRPPALFLGGMLLNRPAPCGI